MRMRGKTRTLARTMPTQKQRDKRFLERVLKYDLSAQETDLVSLLVARYHDAVYQEINHLIFKRYPLTLEILLDNIDFVMAKIKGGALSRESHAPQITEAHAFDPEMKCQWRASSISVRRKAIVIVRLSTLLEEAVNLPDGCYAENNTRISPYLVELGVKHWKRLDDLISLILDDRMLALPAIDMILEHELPTPLTDGAL